MVVDRRGSEIERLRERREEKAFHHPLSVVLDCPSIPAQSHIHLVSISIIGVGNSSLEARGLLDSS